MAAARAAVGWYGDPTVSWSVLLQARVAAPVPAHAVRDRLAELVGRYPHLGAPPPVLAGTAARWPAVTAAFADEPYRAGAPLVRAAVATDEGLLLVAAHHGATDGLGLLAVLSAAAGMELVSQARGAAGRQSAAPFLASAARRLAEALFAPPARVAPRSDGQPAAAARGGDVLVAAELPALPAGSAVVTAATARAVEAWNARQGAPYLRPVAGLGVSRRDGHRATPVPDSTFLRLRLPSSASAAEIGRLVAGQPPEPAFPPSRSRLPALATRLLASRLGSTFLASNLGVVRAPAEVRALTFYPCASGRSGVAVGAATVGATTTITLRARRTSFDRAAADELLLRIVTELGR